MAQRIKVLTAKPDDLNSVPKTYTGKERRALAVL